MSERLVVFLVLAVIFLGFLIGMAASEGAKFQTERIKQIMEFCYKNDRELKYSPSGNTLQGCQEKKVQ